MVIQDSIDRHSSVEVVVTSDMVIIKTKDTGVSNNNFISIDSAKQLMLYLQNTLPKD